jgi:hypothetical protein
MKMNQFLMTILLTISFVTSSSTYADSTLFQKYKSNQCVSLGASDLSPNEHRNWALTHETIAGLEGIGLLGLAFAMGEDWSTRTILTQRTFKAIAALGVIDIIGRANAKECASPVAVIDGTMAIASVVNQTQKGIRSSLSYIKELVVPSKPEPKVD